MSNPLDIFGEPRQTRPPAHPLDVFGAPRRPQPPGQPRVQAGGSGPWEDVTPLVQRRRKPDGTFETRPNPNAIRGGEPAYRKEPEQTVGQRATAVADRVITSAAEGLVSIPELLFVHRGEDGKPALGEYPTIGKEGGFFDLKAQRKDIRRQYEETQERLRESEGDPYVIAAVDTLAEGAGGAIDVFGGAGQVAKKGLQAVERGASRALKLPTDNALRALDNAFGPPPPAALPDPEEAAEAAYLVAREKAPAVLPGDGNFLKPGSIREALKPEADILEIGGQASRRAQDEALGLRAAGDIEDLSRTALDETPAPAQRPFDELADDALAEMRITPSRQMPDPEPQRPVLPRTEPEAMSPPSQPEIAPPRGAEPQTGVPVTVRGFHGTTADFDEFKPGTYFASRRDVAESFAVSREKNVGGQGRVLEQEIRFENPLVVDGEGKFAADFQFGRGADQLQRALDEGGHDGLILRNVDDGAPSSGMELDGLTDLYVPRGAVKLQRSANPPQGIPQIEDAAGTTSLKNAVTTDERFARGLPEVELTARRTLGDDWTKAEARLAEDSGYGRRLAQDIAVKPRTLSSEENAVLLHDRMRLTQEHRAVLEAEEAALGAGDQAALQDAKIRRAGIEEALNVNDEAARRAGYEWGLAGNARQLLIKEDYSPARLVQRARVEAGADPRAAKLLPQVQERVTRLGQEIDQALAVEADVAARATDRQAESAIRQMAKDAAYETRKARRVVNREVLDGEFSALSAEFGKMANRPRAGLDPELALLIGKMAKNRVQAGVVELGALVDNVYQAVRPYVEGLTPREVRDAISGYGKTTQPSKDEIAAQLRELKAQGRLVSALEDAEGGKRPLKSGFQRGEESPKVRGLRQQVTEAMKTHGIGPALDPTQQMRSAIDAAKTRLRRQIEEMTKRLETGAPPRQKTPLAYDAEALALKAERDRLKEALDQIDSAQGLSDAQRLMIAEGATERSIQELEQRIAAGDIAPRKRTSSRWSPKLGALRKRQAELREQLLELRDAAKPPKDPEAARLKALKSRLAKREAELRAQLASGDFSKKPRPTPIKEDAQALAARARVNALKAAAEKEIARLRLAQRSGLDKGIDWTVGWGRALKLTSSATISKLTASGLTKTFLIRPIEEVIGGGLSKLPGDAGRVFRERAPIEGGFSGEAIAASWAKFFSKDVRSAMWGHIRRMEQDPLTLAYGKPTEYFSEGKAPRAFDYPGHIHAALEDVPVKYSAFELAVRKQAKFQRAMEAQAKALLKDGEDLADPIIQLNAEARAFEYATREVFMQSNPLVRGFRRIVDRKSDDPVLLKLGKGFAESQLPIVTVPSNIARERLDYLLGVPRGTFALYNAIKNGVDNLPYEQGDEIARQLKKGIFGLGLAWLGIAQADNIGGYWTGRKPPKNEPQPGEIELFGVTIPKTIAEGPAVAQLHFFATVEKMRQRYRDDGTERGLAVATGQEFRNLPFLDEPAEFIRSLNEREGDAWPRYAGGYLKGMTLPPDVQRNARIQDQRGNPGMSDMLLQQLGLQHIDAKKRHPDTVFEEWQTGVPGLRDDVR